MSVCVHGVVYRVIGTDFTKSVPESREKNGHLGTVQIGAPSGSQMEIPSQISADVWHMSGVCSFRVPQSNLGIWRNKLPGAGSNLYERQCSASQGPIAETFSHQGGWLLQKE